MTRTSYAVGLLGLVAILNFFVGVPVALANTYATWDSGFCSGNFTLSGVNLIATHTGANAWSSCFSTIGVSTGKWYWEIVDTNFSNGVEAAPIGIGQAGCSTSVELDNCASGYVYRSNGDKCHNGSCTAYAIPWSAGDRIGVYFDAGGGTIGFKVNNVDQGQAYSGITAGTYFAGASLFEQNAVATANFGPSTTNSPPSGYNQGLFTAPIVTPLQFFNTLFFGDWF